MLWQPRFGLGCGSDFRDLMVGHFGTAREHILEVSVGINAPSPATFNEGVNNGGSFSGIGFADED